MPHGGTQCLKKKNMYIDCKLSFFNFWQGIQIFLTCHLSFLPATPTAIFAITDEIRLGFGFQ